MAVLLVMPPIFAESAERYYIEGIIADKDKPGESLAVINGTTYHSGDMVDDFKLVEIFPNGVKLQHKKSREEKVLLIGRDSPPQWLVEEDYISEYERREGISPSAEEPAPGVFAGPLGMLQKAKEASAMARIRQLGMALEAFHAELDRYPESLDVLAQAGYVEENLFKGWEDYEFFYQPAADGRKFTLRAESVKPGKAKRLFFLDETGALRAEQGIQAGKNSPFAE